VCGENAVIVSVLWHPIRITPTCVGKTLSEYQYLPSNQDHPHVCGENCLRSLVRDFAIGSPPRVWGKLYIQRSRQQG